MDRDWKGFVLKAIIDAAKAKRAEEYGDGCLTWYSVWTSDAGLYPLRDYSATLRSLEKAGLVEVSGSEEERRSGWGRLITLTNKGLEA